MKWIGAGAIVVAAFCGGAASASSPPGDDVENSFQVWAAEQGQQLSNVACVVAESSATCYGTTADGSVLGATASIPELAWAPITGSPTTANEPAPTTTVAVAPGDNDHLFTFGEINIPVGQPDVVAIVMQGDINEFGSIPMIVRNNTGETVSGVSVSGTARDSAGTLVGTGQSLSFDPETLEAGDWSMGRFGFDVDSLSGDETFEFTVDFNEGPPSFMADVELTVVEVNLIEDRIVGTVSNPSTSESSGLSSVTVACFVDGQLVDVRDGFTDVDEIAPGATASFTVDLFSTPCENFAMSAAGFPV
jgi:hypothetical protein